MNKLHSGVLGAGPRTAISLGLLAFVAAVVTATGSSAHAQQPSIGTQSPAPPVNVSVTSQASKKYETNPILSLPELFARQWIPDRENLPKDYFPNIEDSQAQKLSLKETIYIALQNNPGLL
jgi:hypothetical protein